MFITSVLTFTGSVIACLKLQGTVTGKPLLYKGRITSYMLLLLITAAFSAMMIPSQWDSDLIYVLGASLFSGILGIIWVMGIGGADMPVVISILNSLSGWSGSAAGFMMNNPLLIISGAMVGSSGFILSDMMCVAMNRPLMAVLKGGFGEGSGTKPKHDKQAVEAAPKTHVEWTAENVARCLASANKVYIVPGYGMAVAQCQFTIANIAKLLKSAGKTVKFAVHPVAGRMPGHMNVLLSEANIPYSDQVTLEQANDDFATTDAVLICGSNDCVNPSALTDPDSPIAGMQVLEVWNAKQTIMMKRSMGQGYSGVDNPLFFLTNNAMFLGDAKKTADLMFDKLKTMVTAVDLVAKKSEAVVELKEIAPVVYPDGVMTVGVPRERVADESRAALTPESVSSLRKRKYSVLVEYGTGVAANISDAAYEAAGATMCSRDDVWNAAVILKIRAPITDGADSELKYLNANKTLLCLVYPTQNTELHKALIATGATVLAMDMVPRISRAQALDVLSSMSKIAGYRAVMESAHHYSKFYSAEQTAAGENPPAKFLVIGAGVAGLSVLGTAKKLGAIVRAFDTRPVVREEVESLGGEFLEVKVMEDGTGTGGYAKTMSPEFIAAEMELFKNQAKEVDIIITTALIPGRKAPILIKKEHLDVMKSGSVIVDLAAEQGGNCELTRNNEVVVYNGVKILGYGVAHLVNSMPYQASSMYGQNLVSAMKEFGKDATEYKLDLTNEVLRGMLIAQAGEYKYQPPNVPVSKAPVKVVAVTAEEAAAKKIHDAAKAADRKAKAGMYKWGGIVLFFLTLVLVALYAPETFIAQLMVFALACVAGPAVILEVLPALDTPLMSLSNAISGIVILGAIDMLGDLNQVSETTMYQTASGILNIIAIIIAAINGAGGFLVTDRMLNMFHA